LVAVYSRDDEGAGGPLSVIVLAALLRQPIGGLISLIRRIKYGDLEINFEKGILVAQSLAEHLPRTEAEKEKRGAAVTDRERLIQLAKLSPSGAIMGAWVKVEQALMGAVRGKTCFVRMNQRRVIPFMSLARLRVRSNLQ
jgi:hypothetical protein